MSLHKRAKNAATIRVTYPDGCKVIAEQMPCKFGLAGDFDDETWVNKKDLLIFAEEADSQLAEKDRQIANLTADLTLLTTARSISK